MGAMSQTCYNQMCVINIGVIMRLQCTRNSPQHGSMPHAIVAEFSNLLRSGSMIMFKCLRGSAPAYLADYCTSTSLVPCRSALRSAAHGDIVVPTLTGV